MSAESRSQRKTTPADASAHEELARDHPLEEPQKDYHAILEQHIQQAQEELERPAHALFLSGISAGMDLGFGILLMAALATSLKDVLPRPLLDLLLASAYAVGFIFVVVGRSILFTEQTTSAVLPVLARRVGAGALLRLWAVVLAANVAGGAAIGAVIGRFGPAAGFLDAGALGEIGGRMLGVPWWVTLVSGAAAGWLMGLLSWIVVASRDTISQIFGVWMTTFVIGYVGLHHSIAGTIEILAALFAGAGPTAADYGRFLLWSALGNACGGALFVALLKFGHVRASSAQ